jgi:hypothetical protein
MLHHRLWTATALADHKIQLECYHPSAKYTTPWWFCEYLGTEGLGNTRKSEDSLYADVPATGRLGRLAGLYSHFLPTEAKDRRVPMPHPAGEIPGHSNTSTMYPTSLPGELLQDTVSQIVSLDTNERFSQLCVVANLVRIGKSINWLINSVTLGEGVVRIFRDKMPTTDGYGSYQVNQDPVSESSSCQRRNWPKEDIGEERMLWIDDSQTTGLKVRVTEQKSNKVQPLLFKEDDEVAVSYRVEYQGSPNPRPFFWCMLTTLRTRYSDHSTAAYG